MLIRHADPADAAGCLEIYAPFADATATSFEDHAPSLQRVPTAHRAHLLGRTRSSLRRTTGTSQALRTLAYTVSGPRIAGQPRSAFTWARATAAGGLAARFTSHCSSFSRSRDTGHSWPGSACPTPRAWRCTRASVSKRSAYTGGSAGRRARGAMSSGWQRQLGPDTDEAGAPPSPGPPARLAAPIEI